MNEEYKRALLYYILRISSILFYLGCPVSLYKIDYDTLKQIFEDNLPHLKKVWEKLKTNVLKNKIVGLEERNDPLSILYYITDKDFDYFPYLNNYSNIKEVNDWLYASNFSFIEIFSGEVIKEIITSSENYFLPHININKEILRNRKLVLKTIINNNPAKKFLNELLDYVDINNEKLDKFLLTNYPEYNKVLK